MPSHLPGIGLFLPITSDNVTSSGELLPLIPRHLVHDDLRALITLQCHSPLGHRVCLFNLYPLFRAWHREGAQWILTDYQFSMLANKPGSAFSISFLKIFKINPRDAGRSWQADQKWEKQQETLEFRELCVWQEKYSIHWFSWHPEEPPDALACPLQKIFLKCSSSAIVYQKMMFFNGVQSTHAL